ncbi:Doublecortin domain-containing 5 [Brachionus plicatilis]|uniref:Doublecortin domain-containing 5 n=1 Tax=Brachionus plicatilis TaxID=10195 RepID=A0A3M7STD8_BRAPC|nr:Doublecortin domain-containing 5 [Brachionus plicatilis]
MEGVFEKKTEENEHQEENGNAEGLSKSQSFDQELGERFKPKPRRSIKNRKYSSQKFAYNKIQGFIYSIDNPNYVFGVHDVENTQSEVILMKKNEDNINQRWIYRPDGTFACKARSTLVLTVKIPPIENNDIDINLLETDSNYMQKSIIKGSQITVQQLVDFENGNAHQKWMVDEEIGFIYAFATNTENIAITAANKAGICSYYVTYDKEMSQNGYCCEFMVENKNQPGQVTSKTEKNFVCLSCAAATRGKFRLTKLSNLKNFSCFIGKSSNKNLKNFDGFKFLHDKVDLSSPEIEKTFLSWYSKLIGWRKLTNAKTVLNELSCSKNINFIKIMAYKNGDGWTKSGELIISSSVNGLLEQATSRLQLTQAARRLYTQDGTMILDVPDLITWLVEFYQKQLNKTESNKNEKLVNQDKTNSNRSAESKNLLEKVDFNEDNIKDNSRK